jgi:predicted nuclease of predicted toxin-antitoxin system
VRDDGLQTRSDEEIIKRARSERRIVVSADTDFGTLLALSGKKSPSVIPFRQGVNRRPQAQAAVLLATWKRSKARCERVPSS